MFCNFDIFSLMFMEMQRIKGFVLGKFNNVRSKTFFQLKQLKGKQTEKVFFVFGNIVFYGGGQFEMCAYVEKKILCTNTVEFCSFEKLFPSFECGCVCPLLTVERLVKRYISTVMVFTYKCIGKKYN